MEWLALMVLFVVNNASGLPERGQWDYQIGSESHKADLDLVEVGKSTFAGTNVFVEIICGDSPDVQLSITWKIFKLPCWMQIPKSEEFRVATRSTTAKCSSGAHIPLNPVLAADLPFQKEKRADDGLKADEAEPVVKPAETKRQSSNNLIYTTKEDGIYGLIVGIANTSAPFNLSMHISFRSDYGYLSAADYPLLAFYGVMCLVYVAFGVIWLVVSFLQWRDLLRIQFWVGGVILLGMLEKAVFYEEYQSINATGIPTNSMILLAEWVSCAKRTLARMLVIIVSLGFGIVKPRLGPMLHRVVGTGALYFALACVESYLRVGNTQSDKSKELLVASIPLAVLDSAICWWIFTSLVQTTRTLRLRRNMVKLALYRHFTNTLIFAVIASIIFMLFSIKQHHMTNCVKEWKDYWQDDAFWHVLFSSLLLVIMILWRPTNNNQRYAFTPLLDSPEDEDDDDEEDQFVADVYGVKMRSNRSASPKRNHSKATTTEEDDLRWVEENIPTAIADSALPVLDSDEEIINTRFEVSKMQ